MLSSDVVAQDVTAPSSAHQEDALIETQSTPPVPLEEADDAAPKQSTIQTHLSNADRDTTPTMHLPMVHHVLRDDTLLEKKPTQRSVFFIEMDY